MCYDGETSSARSYRDVVGSASSSSGREPAATPPPAPVPAAARLPVSARIGPRPEVHRVERVPLVDADGFQQPRRKNRRMEPRRTAPPPPRHSPSPEEVAGPCFCYVESGHPVRDCTNDVRCRWCLISGHIARDCEDRRAGRARARVVAAVPVRAAQVAEYDALEASRHARFLEEEEEGGAVEVGPASILLVMAGDGTAAARSQRGGRERSRVGEELGWGKMARVRIQGYG